GHAWVTDSRSDVRYDPVEQPGVSSLLETLAVCTGDSVDVLVGAGRDRTDGGAGTDHCINGEIRSGCERVT
ncbi:MAG: hypothetical protein ACR2GM_10530, partial [Nocardioidaceae bacterium]